MNFVTVKKELSQYDDIFKLIIENHEEHCKILKPEEQSNEEGHFEDVNQGCSSSGIKFEISWKMLKLNMIRNQSQLEEVQRVDHQKNLRDHQDQAKLQAQDHQRLIIWSQKVSSKSKAIEKKVKIAEFLTEAEFMEKSRIIKMEAERLRIQEKVVKALAKSKIYEDLDKIPQKAGKIEVQKDKGNSEHQLKHVKAVADKTNY